MAALEILLWVIAVALIIMLAIVVGSLLYGLITMNGRRRPGFYDRVENALSKRDKNRKRL